MKWYRKNFEKEEQVGILAVSSPGPRISVLATDKCAGLRRKSRHTIYYISQSKISQDNSTEKKWFSRKWFWNSYIFFLIREIIKTNNIYIKNQSTS